MTSAVIDASVAIKWVVEETGTSEALSLRQSRLLLAPDLLFAECANILRKKMRRGELTRDEALLAARLLAAAGIERSPSHRLMEAATRLAISLDHPAYDCLYLALAIAEDCMFVTADEGFVRKAEQHGLKDRVVALAAAAGA